MNERCFAMRRNGACAALCLTRCPNHISCPFYKPRWMFERDRSRINYRLRALPSGKQKEIAEKYHNGVMPWKGDRP